MDPEVMIFSTPACPVCRQAENALTERGVQFVTVDVSASRDGLLLLLRYAARPIVPTIVAYGEVMVGFDRARLDDMLEGVVARAEARVRDDTEEEEQLIDTEAALDAEGIGDEVDLDG